MKIKLMIAVAINTAIMIVKAFATRNAAFLADTSAVSKALEAFDWAICGEVSHVSIAVCS